jgi:hypothetical protein
MDIYQKGLTNEEVVWAEKWYQSPYPPTILAKESQGFITSQVISLYSTEVKYSSVFILVFLVFSVFCTLINCVSQLCNNQCHWLKVHGANLSLSQAILPTTPNLKSLDPRDAVALPHT